MRRSIKRVFQGGTATRAGAVLLLALFGVIGFANRSSGEERSASYLAFKGGIYSPSNAFTLDNLDLDTTFDGDTKTGVNGEIAVGHYVFPTLALELGAGYFKGTGTVPSDSVSARHQVDIDVFPVIVSAKALIPMGPVDPYGEAGIGADFTKLDVSGNRNDFGATATFGIHAGGGVNVNVSPTMFIGAEGRYVWADPSIGGERINLNSNEYSVNGFKLNGFTTTLVLGFGF
jgi:opacity protein-like surface antigen